MKTSTIEVGELVSTLSAAGVQRQLSTLPGVHHADVNYVAGSATVHYDEAKITAGGHPATRCRLRLPLPRRAGARPCLRSGGARTIGDAHAGHADHVMHGDTGGHAAGVDRGAWRQRRR